MAKKMLKGFADLGVFPLTKNDATTYTPGTRKLMPGAQSCSASDSRQDYTVYADDQVFDQGSDYQNTELQITVAQVELADLAPMAGADYDEETGVMSETSADTAPELALSFSGLRSDGGKRLFKYYNCKLTSYKADLKTKGESSDIGAYTLTFKCSGRACDGLVRDTKDVDKSSAGALDISWLQTIAAVPTV